MSVRKKVWIKWTVALVVVLLMVFGVLRALSARKAQQQALAAASAGKAQGLVELAASDVVRAQTLEVVQGLPVSGSLKAFNSAVIKARVAGELQGLTVREGDYVKAGQVLARIDASEYQSRLRQAREQAESAKAQVDVVQRQYDNNKALVDQGFISKTALDASLANLNAAQSTYRAAQAATEVANKSVDDTVLKTPITGQVSQRLAQPGERVAVDTKIIEVVDLGRLELEATLSAADATKVAVGQSAELQIEGGQPGRHGQGRAHQPQRTSRQPQRAGLPEHRQQRQRQHPALAPGPFCAGHAGHRKSDAAGGADQQRAHRQTGALCAGH